MRFEAMNFLQQLEALQKIHRKINRDFFGGELNPVMIDIAWLNGYEGQEDACAVFQNKGFCVNTKTNEAYLGEKIIFDSDFISSIADINNIPNQILNIAAVMLHEMVHQFCFENGIDDANHGGRWTETAKEHGLASIYKDGELIEDRPDNLAMWRFCLHYQQF